MSCIAIIDLESSRVLLSSSVCDEAIAALEDGKILFLPRYRFPLSDPENELFSATVSGTAKNVSYNPASKELRGTVATGQNAELLRGMLRRFSDFAQDLVDRLLPSYRSGLIRDRTSFRPQEIEGRAISWRKDDTRLHIDSFPSAPTQGKRILRVFSNVDPSGRSRIWRMGEPFEQMAARFLPSIKRPLPFSSAALQLLHITKSRRTEYDHIMLQLHDRMKSDARYQAEVQQSKQEFPAGCTWIAFADQVAHAGISGQNLLEQTFLVPLAQLRDEARAPLRVLQRLTGRKLS
jgi:3-deoxy-D-manno-octulosonic acid hydroxylase-like protein